MLFVHNFSYQRLEPVPLPGPLLQDRGPASVLRPVGDQLLLVQDVAALLQVPPMAGLAPRFPHYLQLRLLWKAEQFPGPFHLEGLPPGRCGFLHSLPFPGLTQTLDVGHSLLELEFLGSGNPVPFRRICPVPEVRCLGPFAGVLLHLPHELLRLGQSQFTGESVDGAPGDSQPFSDLVVLRVLEVSGQPLLLIRREGYLLPHIKHIYREIP